MSKSKKAAILVNLGSPESSSVSDVRMYLKEFLSDAAVIDLPSFWRYILVNGIIAPFRSFRSAKLYAKLRTEKGFPLIYHSLDLEKKTAQQLPPETDLFLAMRYGIPSLKTLLQRIRSAGYSELFVIPLYPQFATSTTGSVITLLKEELAGYDIANNTFIVPQFHQYETFISLWADKVSGYNPSSYDAAIFSYHGIPVSQTQKAHPGQSCETLECEHSYFSKNRLCYRAACYQTTRSIAGLLDMDMHKVYTAFQSRFGRNWLSPFTDKTLQSLAGQGMKKVLIVSPAFVAECLETTIEIGEEYQELFQNVGGKELTLVPSLNADQGWVKFLSEMIRNPYSHIQPLGDFIVPG